MRELEAQVQAHVKGAALARKVFPHQIAFNVIPQVDTFGPDGYTGEETKMMLESRKIMGLPHLPVSATCVRVPVVRAHSVAINAEFERPVSVAKAREAIAAFPGAELVDEPSRGEYPTPLDFSSKVKCGVGRIRARHGAPQRPGPLGERRQPLEGRRAQCGPECGAHGSRGLAKAQAGACGRLIGMDA